MSENRIVELTAKNDDSLANDFDSDASPSNSGLISGKENDTWKYQQSNWVQKISLGLVSLLLAMLVVIIGVTSQTYDSAQPQFVYDATVTVVNPAVGLPGYTNYSWNQVLTAASGQEVNFWTWSDGGVYDAWIDNWLKPEVQKTLKIKVNRIPLNATSVAVERVQYEIAKGFGMNNGPWSKKIPNAVNFDFTDPAIAYDGGVPINGMEMPYNGAQVVFIYNTKFINSTSFINTIQNIGNWVKKNPGKFTYAAPYVSDSVYDFTGSVFVRHVFYALAGPYTDFLLSGPAVNEALYEARVTPVWQWLRSIEPYLYTNNKTYLGNFKTYPTTNAAVDALFGLQKVFLTLNYDPTHSAAQVAAKAWPSNVMSYVLSTGTIANTNYLCIPKNAKHKLATVAVANYVASPASMFTRAMPDVLGYLQVYDSNSPQFTTGGWQVAFNTIPRAASTPSTMTLNSNKLSELSPAYITRIGQDWAKCVLNYKAGMSTGPNTAPQPAYCG